MTIYAKMRISNPSPYFETPDQVLEDNNLSRDEKGKVLRSMADDADQMVEATSEGMAGDNPAYNAKDLQSALIQLEKTRSSETVDEESLPNARFQRIMVVTTVNQDLNRVITDIAYEMAEVAGGKVYLLNVVPLEFEGAGMLSAGPMVAPGHPVAAENNHIIEDRKEQLAKLTVEDGSSVETEIEVRRGETEQVIVDYADDCNADVIVVGSPNRTWLEAFLASSIARTVTKSAPCPVLVVPEPV
jgi:nucleotide-binding universal stress UspA family protein